MGMKAELQQLQEQLDYFTRHAKDLAAFSDAYSINRRKHCIENAKLIQSKIKELTS